jgi:protein TonB
LFAIYLTSLLVGSAGSTSAANQSAAQPVVVAPGPVSGAVKVHLHVGADGRATSCEILQSSGNQEDDSRVCRFFGKYARPNIRRDAQGKPVEYDNSFFLDPSVLTQLRNAGI